MCLKALSVQFMFVGSTLLLRVSVCFSHCDYLLSSLIKACLTFPRLLRVPASAQFVTEDPTNSATCWTRMITKYILQLYFFLICYHLQYSAIGFFVDVCSIQMSGMSLAVIRHCRKFNTDGLMNLLFGYCLFRVITETHNSSAHVFSVISRQTERVCECVYVCVCVCVCVMG